MLSAFGFDFDCFGLEFERISKSFVITSKILSNLTWTSRMQSTGKMYEIISSRFELGLPAEAPVHSQKFIPKIFNRRDVFMSTKSVCSRGVHSGYTFRIICIMLLGRLMCECMRFYVFNGVAMPYLWNLTGKSWLLNIIWRLWCCEMRLGGFEDYRVMEAVNWSFHHSNRFSGTFFCLF